MAGAEVARPRALGRRDERWDGRRPDRRGGARRLRHQPRRPSADGRRHRPRRRRATGAPARPARPRCALVGRDQPAGLGSRLGRDHVVIMRNAKGALRGLRRRRSARLCAADLAGLDLQIPAQQRACPDCGKSAAFIRSALAHADGIRVLVVLPLCHRLLLFQAGGAALPPRPRAP
jgi:hypothetical protein